MRSAHRSTRSTRSTRLALLVSTALLLSSCAIPTTGVVESGAPATGIASPTLIYFVKDGALIPVPRKSDQEVGVVTAMEMLLQGPNGEEKGAGVTTAIPTMKFHPKIWNSGKTQVSIRLPPVTRPLSDAALKQLICTTAHARHTQDLNVTSVRVSVAYSSGDSGIWQTGITSGGCSLATPGDSVSPSAERTWKGSASPEPGGGARSRPVPPGD